MDSFARKNLPMKSRRVSKAIAKNVSFPEFVDYLIRTPPNLMDKYWAPYSKATFIYDVQSLVYCFDLKVCIPCNISYDGILKVETIKNDASWLLDKLNHEYVPEVWDKFDERKRESDDKLSREYFRLVKQINIRRLYMKYQVDFEMFGYENQVLKYIDMGYL